MAKKIPVLFKDNLCEFDSTGKQISGVEIGQFIISCEKTPTSKVGDESHFQAF